MTAGRQRTRVLFLSSMAVTPRTGGGNAVFNAVEPPPTGSEAFYATLLSGPLDETVFPELASRVRTFPRGVKYLLPAVKVGEARKRLRHVKNALGLEGLWTRLNVRNMNAPELAAWVVEKAGELRPDVFLLAPQSLLDVIVSNEVMDRTGLPAVVWFMDDYYKDCYSRARVKRLWNRAHTRFVISESMGETFSRLYGSDYEVLAHSINYPREYLPPPGSHEGRLRVLYAGSVNQYYASTMKLALREFAGLGDRVTLDVYTGDDLPDEGYGEAGVSWRKFPLIKAGDLVPRLREYDVLLLLSSFEHAWRATAETAQASKLADYLAAGRCILAYGPPYADNVRYLERHGIGEVVTSAKPGALREKLLALAADPERRKEIGERAYLFGREHRDRAKNHDRLWRALREAARARSGG